MNVAGIDFSSHAIDVVLVDVDGRQPPRWHRYPLTGADAFDRTRSVANSMPGRSSAYWDNVLAVGIEHPAGKFGTGPLMRLQGAVLAQIPARMLVKAWPPGSWRKAVGLPGNASKEAITVRSFLILEDEGTDSMEWPQDAHDAHLIALATQHAITTQEAA
jgi:hypothetical protein